MGIMMMRRRMKTTPRGGGGGQWTRAVNITNACYSFDH